MQIIYFMFTRLLAMINAYRTVINAATPTIILFTNNPPLNDRVAYGDLVEPSGTWYTAATAVLSEVWENRGDGSLNLSVNSVDFNYTGVSAPETITGCALTDGTSVLYGIWLLPTPIVMGSTLDTVVTPVGNIRFPPIGS